uniref:Uncharacterized protein n=1 Tax=Candidatus Nitrotoga fabula TaxID=2182327 RepID=A0A2X0SAJ9_9PROT|nr:protein of unknown function [Candidatus Nitrotoga fabula]
MQIVYAMSSLRMQSDILFDISSQEKMLIGSIHLLTDDEISNRCQGYV